MFEKWRTINLSPTNLLLFRLRLTLMKPDLVIAGTGSRRPAVFAVSNSELRKRSVTSRAPPSHSSFNDVVPTKLHSTVGTTAFNCADRPQFLNMGSLPASTTLRRTISSIAIIGAGPSGLAAAK